VSIWSTRVTFLLEATPGAQEIDAARTIVYLPLIVGLRYREMNVRVCPSGKVTATRSPLASATTLGRPLAGLLPVGRPTAHFAHHAPRASPAAPA
jgi:hypothetical protein